MFCYRVLGCRVSGFQCWGSGFRRSHSDNPGDACLKRYIYNIDRHADNDHHDHDGFESSSLRIRRSCTSFRTVLLSSFTSVSKFSNPGFTSTSSPSQNQAPWRSLSTATGFRVCLMLSFQVLDSLLEEFNSVFWVANGEPAWLGHETQPVDMLKAVSC